MRADPRQVSTLDLLTPNLGLRYSWLVYKFGYRTAHDIQNSSFADILSIPGIGRVRAASIQSAATGLNNIVVSNVVYVDFRQLDLFDQK